MTLPQEMVALLEGAEFWVRTQVVLFLQFPEVLAVETGSTRRAVAMLEHYGIDTTPVAAAAAPVAPGFPPSEPRALATPAPPPTPPSLANEPIPELPDELPTYDDLRDTTDPGEPVIHQDRAPTPFEPMIDPEATELDIDYEDEATIATRLDDLQPLPEDSMEEELGDPPTLGDPDETEDLLRDAGSPAAAAEPEDPDELDVDDLEELDADELEQLDVEELDIAEVDPSELQAADSGPDDDDTSENEVESGEDEVEIGIDEVEIGEDEVEIGEDEVEIGEDEVEIGEDEVEIEDDEVEIEDDEVEIEDDEVEIEDDDLDVGDPGQDALVTMEDTADPRSDLDGLSQLGDSDLFEDDDPLLSDEVVVRKDGNAEYPTPRSTESDLPPDEEETFVADLADIEKMKAKMGEDIGDDASNSEVMVPRPRTPAQSGPRVAAGPRAVAAAGVATGAGVTAGLYGNPNVPQIRDRNAPKPQAAAIQIDQALESASSGGGGGSILEDEELLELGSSEDYGEDEAEIEPGQGGFAVEMQEYEEEEEEEFEEEDDLDLGDPEDDVPLVPVDTGPDPAEVARLMKSAEDAVEEGDLEAAIDFYSDVLDMDPERAHCHVKRGRLYLDYGDYSRAMSDFMLSEELEPTSPEPQVAVGDLYFARKDYNRAIEYFNRALQMDPNHAMAFCRRGISHYYRKNYRDALEDLNKAQQLDGDIPNIRTYIAMAKKKARR